MSEVFFQIEGMHCDSCARTLQILLEREPGVKRASVSFDQACARVVYDPAMIEWSELVAALERPGYRVIGSAD